MESLTITLWILVISIVVSFGYGLITRNYSTVDRLWSILPAVYVLVWMRDFSDNLRFIVPSILVVLWGVRLTINFALKGGYRFSWKQGFTEEDYRWPILKQKIPNRFVFELFNLSFISFYQLALVFGFTLPLYYLGELDADMTTAAWVLAGVQALLLLVEMIADIQQLAYYRKRGDKVDGADSIISVGFNTSGLWRHSRHPNYLCEMGQWICVYFQLHLAFGGVHPSGLFAVLLVLLFVGSTTMAERITLSKYPAYAEWRKATPPWIPFIDLPLRASARRDFFQKYSR